MIVDPALVAPATTAVVTSELQRGVVGPEAVFPDLARDAAGAVAAAVRVVTAARGVDVPVVHGVAWRRADGRGSNDNARLFAAAARAPVVLEPGSHAAALLPEVAAPQDLVVGRLHGLSPMAGTDLDPLLRNLGVRTIVVVGVSVNVAVTNLVMDAVNAGYQVVLPVDAVAGTPPAYTDLVIANTLRLLATTCTTAELVAAWSGCGRERT
ncbi:isochorismatase family protein [Nitriliruptor alkaliphilus]|uniref:isochorismatase family protein n=1 Tax=Nitriliruptor alkaliphilus TaxID=427918 RepID=UPI0006978122|nr:isochorismatase family protein [Nitriliruptor alkaliphilus]